MADGDSAKPDEEGVEGEMGGVVNDGEVKREKGFDHLRLIESFGNNDIIKAVKIFHDRGHALSRKGNMPEFFESEEKGQPDKSGGKKADEDNLGYVQPPARRHFSHRFMIA